MRKRSGFGWIEFISGICMLILGLFTLFKPGSMFTGIAVIYGVIAVITGICDIVFYIKTERYTGFAPIVALVSGILSVMAGVILLGHPSVGKWIVSILFPLWFITHCISRLAHLGIIRLAAGDFCYYLSLITNIAGLILGILMLFEPAITLFTIGALIGIYLIAAGIESIILALSRMGSGW